VAAAEVAPAPVAEAAWATSAEDAAAMRAVESSVTETAAQAWEP